MIAKLILLGLIALGLIGGIVTHGKEREPQNGYNSILGFFIILLLLYFAGFFNNFFN